MDDDYIRKDLGHPTALTIAMACHLGFIGSQRCCGLKYFPKVHMFTLSLPPNCANGIWSDAYNIIEMETL